MSTPTLELLCSLVFIAVAFMLLCTPIIQFLTDLSTESRVYQDRLPMGFLLLWPAINLCVYWFGRKIPLNTRQRVHQRLCIGGVDYVLSPEQFIFAHACAGALVFAIFLPTGLQLELELPLLIIILLSLVGGYSPTTWLQRHTQGRAKSILRDLPSYLDLMALCLESGLNFVGAITTSVEKSHPSPLHHELSRVLRELKSGKTKVQVLQNLRTRCGLAAIDSLVSSLIQSDKTGAPLGRILRAQADQRRFERFSRAEKLGLEAPVKLLGPLVMFIFPSTFVVLGFLITVKLYQTGLFQGPIMKLMMSNPMTLFIR